MNFKRGCKILLLLMGMVAILLFVDSMRVRAKEQLAANAISNLGGKMGSLPAWPLGTEYYITFGQALSESELKALEVLNSLRGYVTVKFSDCELSDKEQQHIRERLADCHVLWEYEGSCKQIVVGP